MHAKVEAFRPVWLLAVAAILWVAAAAQGDDASLAKDLTTLNRITGSTAVDSSYKLLLADPEGAKKLIKFARQQVKDKKITLSYNAAMVLGESARELKDLDASVEFLRLCTAEAARLESEQKLYESYFRLIDAYFDAKKYNEAAKVCRELMELKTGPGKPRLVLRVVTSRFGEPDFVEDEEYDSVRRIRILVNRQLIQILAKQGKYDQALKKVEDILAADDHWEERQLKAWVLREAGRYAEAASAYEDVLERIIKDRNLTAEKKKKYEERTRYILSGVYVDAKQIDKAAEQLQALIARMPNEPGYHNDLGYIWADNDMNLEEAEKLIQKALDLDRKKRKANPNLKSEDDRDNSAYLDSMGWVLFKQKKYKEAKEYLLKAVSHKDGHHIEIYDHLGDVHMALGEREAALAAWRRGLEVAGDSRREQERKTQVEKKIQKHQ